MKVKYSSELLLKDLKYENFDEIIKICRESNFKLNFGEDYLQIRSSKAIYFIGIMKIDNDFYYSITQLSKYKNEINPIKKILRKIESIDNLTILN